MTHRFTVGADESFPLPPLAAPPAGGLPTRQTSTNFNYGSDSSGDSGISVQFLHGHQYNHQSSAMNGFVTSTNTASPGVDHFDAYPTDRTAEWLGTKCDTVNRRQPRGGAHGGSVNATTDATCRHSTASSGSSSGSSGSSGYTGSGNHVTVSPVANAAISRLHNAATESRLSYVSMTSSGDSRTSLDRIDSDSVASNIDVCDLLRRGYSDSEVLYAWLASMHLDQLHQLFNHAGYDMPTISRMTPEDLTAIGITQPSIRKRLTMEISRLNFDDHLRSFRPATVQEWLHVLNLEEYYPNLMAEGYTTMEAVTDIAWEDLEDIGVHKLGHQKKLMLAIDRFKKPMLNRLPSDHSASSPAVCASPLHQVVHVIPTCVRQTSTSGSPTAFRTKRSISGEGVVNGVGSNISLATTSSENSATEIIHLPNTPVIVRPEVVAIQVNRSSSSKFVCDVPDQSAVKYESFRGPLVPMRTSCESFNVDEQMTSYDDRLDRYNDKSTPVFVEQCVAEKSLPETRTPPLFVPPSSAAVVNLVSSIAPTSSPTSPAPPDRPRPQIAPKPKVDIRRRRASAGSTSSASAEQQLGEIAIAAAAKIALKKTNSQCGESFSAVASEADSVDVGVAADSKPTNVRKLPMAAEGASSDHVTNGHAVMNHATNGHVAISRATSMVTCSSPSSSASSFRLLPSDGYDKMNESQSYACREVTDQNTAATGLARSCETPNSRRRFTTSSNNCETNANVSQAAPETMKPPVAANGGGKFSPSRKAPPPPPKRTNSFKGDRRSAEDIVGGADHYPILANGTCDWDRMGSSPALVSLPAVKTTTTSNSVVASPTRAFFDRGDDEAAARMSEASCSMTASRERLPNCSPGPFDTNTLPFANENIGTIRQRAAPSSTADGQMAESPTAEKPPIVSGTATPKKSGPRPVPMKKPKVIPKDHSVKPDAAASAPASRFPSESGETSPGSASTTAANFDDVFNDIDDMFQGLAQELDYMLKS